MSLIEVIPDPDRETKFTPVIQCPYGPFSGFTGVRGCLVSQSEGEHETFSRPKYADLEVRTGSTGRQTEPKGEG
ncbi:hypothetical protein, partial [Rhodocaloribacter sp.]